MSEQAFKQVNEEVGWDGGARTKQVATSNDIRMIAITAPIVNCHSILYNNII